MRRRDFIALVGGAAASVSTRRLAHSQENARRVIGYLHFATPDYIPTASTFLNGIRQYGYVEGKNLAVEYRWAEGRYDRLAAMAADLVARKVDLIAAFGPPPPPALEVWNSLPSNLRERAQIIRSNFDVAEYATRQPGLFLGAFG